MKKRLREVVAKRADEAQFADVALTIAKQVHPVVWAYGKSYGDVTLDRSEPWGLKAADLQHPTTRAVLAILLDPNISPSACHNAWAAERAREGWRYGPDFDPFAKTHPYLIAYTRLPKNVQFKYMLFVRLVLNFAEAHFVKTGVVPSAWAKRLMLRVSK